jgi:hypothetical protein
VRSTYQLLRTEGETSEDTKRRPSSKGNLHSAKAIRERQVRTPKNVSKQTRGTHTLLGAEEGTNQDIKRKPASKGHSLPVKSK